MTQTSPEEDVKKYRVMQADKLNFAIQEYHVNKKTGKGDWTSVGYYGDIDSLARGIATLFQRTSNIDVEFDEATKVSDVLERIAENSEKMNKMILEMLADGRFAL